ncbi:hypothetical protein [Planococcus glaciei]|uniref:hypothetical protein n=1 Tax=Planococcus glaciei TaxID=459472 RepID=UPI001C729D79|nr:hypothetical protein [Planococcus glaciei]MBX0315123.1 hypothetical protein [Planococcus glaciei]
MAKRRVCSRTAKVAYDPRIWSLQLDNKKSGGARSAPTSAGGLGRDGALCHHGPV